MYDFKIDTNKNGFDVTFNFKTSHALGLFIAKLYSNSSYTIPTIPTYPPSYLYPKYVYPYQIYGSHLGNIITTSGTKLDMTKTLSKTEKDSSNNQSPNVYVTG